MLNGAALIILALKLEKVPELKVFSEKGEYVGRVKGVEAREGKFEKLEVKDKVLSKEDIAIKDVLVLKDKKIEKHEFIGKEVYTTKGQYLGKVESVSLDPEGNVSQFTTIKDGKKKVVQGEKINSSGEVILVSCFI
jgi:sporulation protein YlmC with PRC-barrel domain